MKCCFPVSTIRRAFTVFEVLVGAALSLLVTAVVYQLFAVMLPAGSELTTRAHMQQIASVALGRMAADARRSSVAGVSLSDQALGLIGLADVDASGQQIWEQKLVFYYGRGTRLMRREVESDSRIPLSSQLPTRLSPAELNQLAGQGGGTCLCDCLEELQARLYGPERDSEPLTLFLRLGRSLAGGRSYHLELTRDVYLRNAP